MRRLSEFYSKEFAALLPEYGRTFKSKRTFDEYVGYINLLCNYLSKDFLEITTSDAQKYIDHLMNLYYDEKLSRKTICVRLSSYKSLASYLSEFHPDTYPSNQFEEIKRPEAPDGREVNPLSIPSLDEIDEFLSLADPMMYVIIMLIFRVGLSSTSIVRFRSPMLQKLPVGDKERYFIIYPPKNDFASEQQILLPDDVAKKLLIYIDSKKSKDTTGAGMVFFNKYGKPLTIRNLDSYFSKILEKSSCDKHYTLKDIRTRAILQLANSGASEESISDYVGLSQLRVKSFVNARYLVNGTCPADLVNIRMVP